jgi:hypothetical protein
MIILGLTFDQALKYAFLGDRIGRTTRSFTAHVKLSPEGEPDLVIQMGPHNSVTADDFAASDWLAMSTRRSV